LKRSLPKKIAGESEHITKNLIEINPLYYVLPDLLNQRYTEVQKKIEECISSRMSHIAPSYFDVTSQSLIEKAKPEIANLIEKFKELKKQNDGEVKEKLLPLLRKYISKPI